VWDYAFLDPLSSCEVGHTRTSSDLAVLALRNVSAPLPFPRPKLDPRKTAAIDRQCQLESRRQTGSNRSSHNIEGQRIKLRDPGTLFLGSGGVHL